MASLKKSYNELGSVKSWKQFRESMNNLISEQIILKTLPQVMRQIIRY